MEANTTVQMSAAKVTRELHGALSKLQLGARSSLSNINSPSSS